MSLYKRGNTYWAHFGVNGEIFRKSLETADPKKAERLERELFAEAKQGRVRSWKDTFERLPFHLDDPDPEKLGALERYRRDRAPQLAASTARSELDHSKPLADFFGKLRVANITEDKVRQYIGYRHAAGRKNAKINKELGILIGVLRRAKRLHCFPELRRLKEEKSIVGKALDHAEKLRLLRVSQDKPKLKLWARARMAAILALNTTMRAGEIRNLRWQDVDLEEKTVIVRRGKTRHSQREIPLNRDAFQAIMALRDEAKKAFRVASPAPDWFVFFSIEEADPTRASGWRTAWRSITRAVNCPKCGELQEPAEKCANEKCGADIAKVRSPIAGLRFHDLRHQAITELSEGQASDETIMSLAGHIDRRMMSHYSHVRRQAKRAAVDQLCAEKPAAAAPSRQEQHNSITVAPGTVQ